MDYGKKISVGNFIVVKKAKSLSKKDINILRNDAGIPMGMRKHLTRGQLPYMRVECVGGGWAVEFGFEQTMFSALDELPVDRDESGNLRIRGTQEENVKALFIAMMANTTIVGDEEYQRDKIRALDEYLKRHSKKEETYEEGEQTV